MTGVAGLVYRSRAATLHEMTGGGAAVVIVSQSSRASSACATTSSAANKSRNRERNLRLALLLDHMLTIFHRPTVAHRATVGSPMSDSGAREPTETVAMIVAVAPAR